MYSLPRLIALMVCSTLVIVTASLPSFSHAQPQENSDVYVDIGPIVKSQTVTAGGAVHFPVDVWSVEVSVGNLGSSSQGVNASLDVSTGAGKGKEVCSKKTYFNAISRGAQVKTFKFEIVYPREQAPRGPASVETDARLQPPVPYTIKASAPNTPDKNPGNNQKSVTRNFRPGGTPACLTLR